MASFGVVSLFAVLLMAFCVSNSEACTRDIDCLGQCKHGGFCDLKTKKCSCLPVSEQLPSNIASIVDAMQR
ncbi:hypothetical protein ES288_A08G037500v1 [Gossypium darwinii]|uniref:Invertebrate defensins family profile domain-containing protein n=2 Tax=Gossypium TaxID=3633 RepID=A0A5D2PAL4_GOSTO|nr:hypothetical protein ES288_A08G037500v1 [Gossypium darwinii]TYI13169.1 hypothetical protein ES332_A08G039500v1 [Gossypium tomentosum]